MKIKIEKGTLNFSTFDENGKPQHVYFVMKGNEIHYLIQILEVIPDRIFVQSYIGSWFNETPTYKNGEKIYES